MQTKLYEKCSLITQLYSCYCMFKLLIEYRVIDYIVKVNVLSPYEQPEGILNFEIIIFVAIHKVVQHLN